MRPVLIITGVGKGFGRELLKYFVRDYFVVGITRSEEDISAIREELSCTEDSLELIACDVTNYECLETTLSLYLKDKSDFVYGLINNAGVRCREPFLNLSMEDIKSVAEVNLFAAIFLSKIVLPFFIKNGGGRIINISSVLSKNALPDLSAYTISKAGLDGFTRSLSAEFGNQGITCNSIMPGFCKTSYFDKFKSNSNLYEMTLRRTPANRWGTDEELIGLCELLLSARGGYINGASIPIDGGWTAS